MYMHGTHIMVQYSTYIARLFRLVRICILGVQFRFFVWLDGVRRRSILYPAAVTDPRRYVRAIIRGASIVLNYRRSKGYPRVLTPSGCGRFFFVPKIGH